MPDFGPQSGYILAAYGLFALGLMLLLAASLLGRANARRRVERLEQDGG